ncbi:23S rRNA (pseudouridine(1915)-N(3))-methyltransferase RlmH [Desulfohalovibrio reitneri]|uniref:23S rRNA (pseudouridine(1915)-N(3))-methyltransferase RlmH n=1 Tax=Desulfohalovibrio reitneri TaxID=1307759 RepID=UPI0004A71438|nr:23S rRNA (pseudouridine(1915)-N(3))-methyltransferase RlmH [Desulfohalovibrio reitneri]
MSRLTLLAVGKLKQSFYAQAADHYRSLLTRHLRLTETEVRDAPAKLPDDQRKQREAATLLDKRDPRSPLLAMDERGKALDSRAFSLTLVDYWETGRTPCLILGGPLGLASQVRERADRVLSLGSMTLPHELARVVLLEQIYRAVSIWRGFPYHND